MQWNLVCEFHLTSATGILLFYFCFPPLTPSQAMVPFWDALNHITGKANIRLSHQEKRGRGGVLQMIATRDIAAGEEVVNNYGELSQAELLRAYGFVETHPEAEAHAHVQVPLRYVVQAAQAEAARLLPEAPPSSGRQPPQGKEPTQGTDTKEANGDQPAVEQGKRGKGQSGDSESEDGGSDSSEGGLSEFGLGGSADEEEGCGQRGREEAASHGDKSGGTGATVGGEAGANEPGFDGPKEGGAFERSREKGASTVGQGGKGGDHSGQDADHSGSDAPAQEQPRSSQVIRGLSTRLRMCACFGLMPRSGVFKVYDPAATGVLSKPGRPFPPPELTEVARMLLLPLCEVRALQQRAAAWRPHTGAQGLAIDNTAKHDSQAVTDLKDNTAKQDSQTVVNPEDNPAKHDSQTVIDPKSNTAKHDSQTVIDPGPVTDELAAAVQAVVCRVAARMQGRYTSGLEDDEQLLQRSMVMQGAEDKPGASRQQQEQLQDLSRGEQPEERAAGNLKKRKGEEKELVGTKKRRGSAKGMQQQEQQQQHQQQQELSPRLTAAVVARVGEKRCLARLREWWECAAVGSSGSGAPVQQQQQQQQQQQHRHRLCKCVRDHVAAVWSTPRPGMHRVRREGSDDEDDSDEEDEESNSSSSSSGDEGEGTSGDEGRDGQGAGGKAGPGGGQIEENSKGRHTEGIKVGGRSKSSAGAAAKGGDAQVSATLSRPNLQQKQHFSFNFAL
ncbi:hypothetical protein DUNSADRAFT_2218 [Dunaliella salina]|uniref:SET domain-containing protein n=1 Tax=Dunaliella salina TaxID=3046 RepID=A0ABQ7FWJ8_DUNSA|nr:hypothetical protein DUNSADRAFT_2218 [Dunaliella salina]|eukprot:KAF5826732.1 hypothetical protein DUNSADRAFT_2218 [Dunaliella salina]